MQIIRDFFRENKIMLIKYAIVGVIATIVDFSILYVLTDVAGFHYLLSATASFVVAAMTNYYIQRKWTFKSNGKKRRQLPVFFTIAIIGVILNNNILYLGVEYFYIHYMLAKVFASAVVMIWNFFGNKYLTFKVK